MLGQKPVCAVRLPALRLPPAACVLPACDQELNDHPVLLEYLAKHVLAEGLAAVQQV